MGECLYPQKVADHIREYITSRGPDPISGSFRSPTPQVEEFGTRQARWLGFIYSLLKVWISFLHFAQTEDI